MTKESGERFDKFVSILRRVFGFEKVEREEKKVKEAKEIKRIKIGEDWKESDYYKSTEINYHLLVHRQLELTEAIRGLNNKIYNQARDTSTIKEDISGIKTDISWIKRILWVIVALLISLFLTLI